MKQKRKRNITCARPRCGIRPIKQMRASRLQLCADMWAPPVSDSRVHLASVSLASGPSASAPSLQRIRRVWRNARTPRNPLKRSGHVCVLIGSTTRFVSLPPLSCPRDSPPTSITCATIGIAREKLHRSPNLSAPPHRRPWVPGCALGGPLLPARQVFGRGIGPSVANCSPLTHHYRSSWPSYDSARTVGENLTQTRATIELAKYPFNCRVRASGLRGRPWRRRRRALAWVALGDRRSMDGRVGLDHGSSGTGSLDGR
jgi:hypothetical protein